MTGYTLNGAKTEATKAARSEGGGFHYDADGHLKYATDHLSRSQGTAVLDRAYSYDPVGRLNKVSYGADARAFAGDPTSGLTELPPPTGRPTPTMCGATGGIAREFWGGDDSTPADFDPAASRNPAWEYDADGRLFARQTA